MIDMTSEKLLTFTQAAKALPSRPHVSTLHRWRLRGVHGVRLETVLVGGRRFTSVEAVERFAARTTAADEGQPLPIRSPNQRERAVQRAAKLPQDHKAVQYLRSRNFDPQRIGKFYDVHYCYDGYRDTAVGRLIIPVCRDKRRVGWQARYIGEVNWKSRSAPDKYYTCPGTPCRQVIYNLANAARYQTGVIVEGPTDVWSFGPMACGTFGARMTISQQRMFLDQFRDYAAVLLYDWDARDKPGTQKIEEAFADQFSRGFCKVVLPEGQDPGGLDRPFLRDFVTREARKAGVTVSWDKR